MGTTISNPISLASSTPNSVVSDLENALMNSIGQEMQSGQNTNGAGLQQEMQLLTELLSQSDNSQGNSSPANGSAPSTNSGDPPASSAPSSTSSNPTNTGGADKSEKKLDTALERNITDRLQNGQNPNNGNALGQEMNLLIELLGQGA